MYIFIWPLLHLEKARLSFVICVI
jgi:hypothetical protein